MYIRVSHQGERGKNPGGGEFISPEMQLADARSYAALRLKGYTFDEDASKANADIDVSASRVKWRKRPGLVAHLEAAKRGELHALIVFKMSRFARSAREGLELFDLFEETGCSIHCIKEQIDTATPSGRLVRTILLAVAEMESENISEFVKASARMRAQKGLPHGTLPFWISKNDAGEYVLNERAKDIRKLIDLRLSGLGQNRIARKLNAEGIPTSEGRVWTSSAISKYLTPDRLSLLCGDYIFGPDKEEGDPDRIVVQGLFPAVITTDEAEQVLALNRKLAQMYGLGGPRRAANTTYVLSGIFRCAACGGPMRSRTSYPKGERPRSSYECRASNETDRPHPDGITASADNAEDAVMRVVLLAARDYQQQFKNAPAAKPSEAENGSALDKRIQAITDRILRLVEGYDAGIMKREDFQPRYDTLVSEREKLRAQLEEYDSASSVRAVMKEALTAASGPKLSAEQARRLVLAIVERVDGPVAVDPVRAGVPKTKRCRGLWVTLHLPLLDGTTRMLAPMYDVRFAGKRVVLDREPGQ